MKIKFCEENQGHKEVIQKLQQSYPKIEIKIKDCLGECKFCSKSPIAMIKDKLIVGKDTDDLYKKIVEHI